MYILDILLHDGLSMGEKLIILFGFCLALLLALCIHEYAHAFLALKMGDPTAKIQGRLTINPSAHLDPLGVIMLLFLGFGWAKPVPINPYNFEHYKKGMVLVSLAGIVANFILAIISYIALMFIINTDVIYFAFNGNLFALFGYTFFSYLLEINLALFAFNILPLYPLDGYRLLGTITNESGKFFSFLRRYSSKIFLVLIFVGIVADRINMPALDVLSTYVNFVVNKIIQLFDLIGGLFV